MKKILVIDDDKVVLTLAEKTLSTKYEVTTATSGVEALSLFKANIPDLVLSDLLMPEMSGYELQRSIGEMSADRIPFVFMTSDESDESESKGFEQGAWDYIRKPVKAELLLKRIDRIFINVDEEKKLRQAAATDAMTSLLNKTSSAETISRLCKDEGGAILMIDLDNFKMVNDIYGHEMGDRILISFAKLMRSVFRENDTLGRVGGDEFIAFCPTLHDENTIAEKTAALNDGITAAAKEYMGDEMDIPLGCSVGAAYILRGLDFKTQLSKADEALYEAKRSGKHGYKVFHSKETELHEKKSGDLESLGVFFAERNRSRGAWIVDESQFRTAYRFLERFTSNYPWDVRFVVFTLGTDQDSGDLAELTTAFCDISYRILRSSDIILRYSPGKVAMLLMKVDDESSLIPIKRVANAWSQSSFSDVPLSYRSRRIGIHTEIT